MAGRPPLHQAAAGTIVAILAAIVLAADQFTKHLAIENLPPGEPVPVLGDFLIFILVRNPGAAFSLGEGVTWLFTIALAGVAVAIVWLAVRGIRSRLWAVALGLLLGGVLGNLTDRMFRAPGFPIGHVVDFINTPWMMPAIYNVADIFIVSMMIGVALLVLVGLRLDGGRDRGGSHDDTAPTAEGAADVPADSDAPADADTTDAASDGPGAPKA